MSESLVPSEPASPSSDLLLIAREWTRRHLEIVLPLCAAAGAAAGAYFVAIFHTTRLAAMALSYDIPRDFLSSDPLRNLIWVAFGIFYVLSVVFVGILAFDIFSLSSF